MSENKYTYNELINNGFVVIDWGYDELTNWIVVEKEGKKYYYYLFSKTLEEIDESKAVIINNPNKQEE